MPTYTLETPRGKRLTIESDSPENATRLADTWDLEDHAVSEATRLGVNPDTALRQMRQESGSRANAVSPKGARGPMQLMPETAKGLGVDPDDPYANITGGLTYYKQQLDAHGGDERLALAAYNAGPAAVRRYGGVPPFAETQKYVQTLAGNPPRTAAPGLPAPPPTRAPAAGAPARPQAAQGPAQSRTRAQDAGLGLASGAEKGGASMADTILGAGPLGFTSGALQSAARIGDLLSGKGPQPLAPPMATPMANMAARNGFKPQTRAGKVSETIGTMLPNALMPGSIPQRILNVILPALGQEGAERGAKAAGIGEGGQKIAGVVGAGLGGASAGIRLGPKAVKLPTADLGALDAAQKAAWAKVDASTYRFPATASATAARDVRHIVTEADVDLYPDSAKWAAKLERMADRGELTLGKLNTLKSQMGEQLATGKEASVGKAMIARVEQLINTARDPSLATAREAYKRFKKVQDVMARLEDGGLARTSSGTGGNTNAVRQAVKPLVKKRGAQRMTNATADETKAMKRVVNGGPMENALRVVSAADPFKGKLSAMLQGGFQSQTLLPSGGLSLLVPAAGMAASQGEKAIQARNVQKMLDLFAAGGVRPKPAPLPPRPYAGAAAVTAPLLIAAPAIAQPRPKPKARRPR